MLTLTPNGKHFAECSETGAYMWMTRAQWTLVCKTGETRHWQRAKVSSSDILSKAQKSLDKIIAEHKGE